jgi:high affinity sulfate transporter 1
LPTILRRVSLAPSLADYRRGWLLPDTLAGLTLAAIAISESMGYAKIAGMPAITGLYTGLLPVVAFALLGSSRMLVVGADSATAAILFAGLSGLGIVGLVPGSARWVALAGAVALLVGLVIMLAGVARLGFLANFLSRSALLGLFAGIGVSVAVSQVGDMLGIAAHGLTWQRVFDVVRGLPHASWPAAATAAGALAILVTVRMVSSRIPAALVAVVAGIVVSAVAHLSTHGVALVGHLSSGLPPTGLPDASWTQIARLTVPIVAIAIIALTQSAATSRTQAAAAGEDVDDNADLRGLGLANMFAGLSGTFPVAGSPTKTRVVVEAGSRSQVAQLVSALATLVVLIFATGLISRLPQPVLAAVVFVIGVDLVDVDKMRRVAQVRRDEFAVAVLAGLGVVGLGVEVGMAVAVVLSLLILIGRVYRPYTAVLVPVDQDRLHEAAPLPGVVTAPGLVVFRFGARLFYANVHPFYRTVLGLLHGADPPLKWLVLDLRAVGDIDYTAGEMLRQLHQEVTALGIRFSLAGVDEETRALLDRLGLLAVFGPEQIYERVREPIREHLAGGPPGAG